MSLNKKHIIPVAIVMGSKSDWNIMKFTAEILNDLNIQSHIEIISAHRTPDKLFKFAESSCKNGFKIIIAGAGGAAHLPGMLAAKTLIPILGVPINSTELQGVDSLYSIVQMPYGIPVGTLAIGKAGALNAGLLAAQILSLNNKLIFNNLVKWRQKHTDQVLEVPDPRDIK